MTPLRGHLGVVVKGGVISATRGRGRSDPQDGNDGEPGATGAAGAPGAAGATGAKGDKGDKGDPGDPGPPGADGMDGADGADGADGMDGADGLPGEKGDKGDKGDQGDPGPPGPKAGDSIVTNHLGTYAFGITESTEGQWLDVIPAGDPVDPKFAAAVKEPFRFRSVCGHVDLVVGTPLHCVGWRMPERSPERRDRTKKMWKKIAEGRLGQVSPFQVALFVVQLLWLLALTLKLAP